MDQVVGIVYVCAFMLDVGESLASTVGGAPPDWWDLHEDLGYVRCPQAPKEIFLRRASTRRTDDRPRSPGCGTRGWPRSPSR